MNFYKVFRYPFNQYGLRDAMYHVKWAWQRVFRGYDDRAVWGLDEYLTNIILPVLKEHRKYHDDDHDGGLDNVWEVGWLKKLDKMILAFSLLQEADYISSKIAKKHIKEGLELFAKHYTALWL